MENIVKPTVALKTDSGEATKVTEVWRNSSLYTELMVSNLGRVKEREYMKIVKDKDGSSRIYQIPSKMLQPFVSDATGDVCISFYSNGNWTHEMVDNLVATEFVSKEHPSFNRLKHIDRNKANVKASNLAWEASGKIIGLNSRYKGR